MLKKSDAMIKVENLRKSFKLTSKQQKEFNTKDSEAKSVDGISFACQPGKIFSLLGPNGAGKTTTLRMLSTIIKPTSGTIEVAGFNVDTQANEVRKRIGFLTGSTGLYERLTPDEILKYYADLNDVSGDPPEKAVDPPTEVSEGDDAKVDTLDDLASKSSSALVV